MNSVQRLWLLLAAGVLSLSSAWATSQMVIFDAGGNLIAITPSAGGAAPTITAPPRDQLGQVGGFASFSVSAGGSPTLAYQWKRNGTGIGGATGATLFLKNLATGDFTSYTVVVSNGISAIESNPAQLLLDSTGSGMSDAWQLAHFGDLLQTPSGDFDHDGVSNRDEYRDGTDPAAASSHYFVLKVSPTSGGTVTVQPAQARYAPGANVTITAVADVNVTLLEWSGDASGNTAALPVVMDQDRTIAALFGVSLVQALDGSNILWATSGNGPWHGLLHSTHDGVDAAVGSALTTGEQSRLDGTMVGRGKVTFWWRLFEFSQAFVPGGTDSLTMDLDGRTVFKLQVNGWTQPTIDWVQGTLYTTPGTHGLGWLYAKDPAFGTSSVASVDEVNFTPITPAPGMEEISYPLRLADQFDTTNWSTNDPATSRGLLQAADGNFYGTTPRGGTSGIGSFFQLTPAGTLKTLHSFPNIFGVGTPEGVWPNAGVIQGADGAFYGTTSRSVYKITAAGVLTTLLVGGDVKGRGLATDLAGNLYGTTGTGGTLNAGTIFKLTPGGTLTTLHSFQYNDRDGGYPTVGLTFGKDGKLYGVTPGGGASRAGVVFQITPTGTFKLLHSFRSNGASPTQSCMLVRGIDGNFYGTTSNFRTVDLPETVYQITPTGVFTEIHTFGGDEGSGPVGGLVQAPDGNFYGVTSTGGLYGFGTLYRVGPAGAFMTLHAFNGQEEGSAVAAAPLVVGTDGKLYGMTTSGGNGAGVFYRFTPPPVPPQAKSVVGAYDGLLTNPSPTNDNSGYFTIKLTTSGGLSGKLFFGGAAFTLRGKFGANDKFTQTILRRGLSSLVVNLTLDRGVPPTIAGTVSAGADTSDVLANLQAFSKALNPVQAGKYTLLLPATNVAATGPHGDGFALVKVSTLGVVTAVGKLGNGRPWSAGGLLRADGSVPLYAAQPSVKGSSRGSIGGTLFFRDVPAMSDCDGTFAWYVPGTLGGTFLVSSPVFGARYTVPPRDTRALNLPVGKAHLSDGNIGSALDIPFTINVKNRVIADAPNPHKLAVTITSASGLFSGSFLHPVRLKRTPFSGVLIQKQNLGGSVFLGTDTSGSVTLGAP